MQGILGGFKMSPAKSLSSRWPLFLGFVAFAFLLKACAERGPTESAVSTTPRLAQGSGTQCTSATQSIGAPCVEVTVTVSSKGQDQPVDGSVVELYNGGLGSASGEGLIGIDLTDSEGKVVFDLSTYLSEGDPPLGLCAVFKGLTDVNFSLGGSLRVIPNTESDGMEVSADYEGRVTDTKKKDGAPLTLDSFVENCINWTDPAAAPVSVAFDGVEKLSLKTKTSFSLETACRFPNGFIPNTYCNSWMVLDLTKGTDLDGDPLCTEEDFLWTCNFWVGTVPYKGIKPGLIVSGDGSRNAAINKGLVRDAKYQGELAFFGNAGEFLTASLKDILQADGDGKPGGGPPPKDGTTDLSASVDMLPTTCVTNELFESNLDGGAGWNLRNPIKYGYFGSTPYSYAIFAPDLEHIAIWFDMTAPAGGFTEPANANLQLHMRSKPDPNYPDGAVGPTTDNIVARYDFLPCLSGGSPVPLNTDPAVMSADCRRVVRTDELGNTFEAVEVTYVVNSDLARLYEFRVEASGDFTPETARSDDTRAMTLIDKPEASFSCPLKDGTTGVSTDPKWVTPAG